MMARTRPFGSRRSQKPSPPMWFMCGIDRGDAGRHRHHGFEGVAAFGQHRAAGLGRGRMRRADDATAVSGGVQVHGGYVLHARARTRKAGAAEP